MTDYLHHVPGRLRVKAKAFRCDSAARSTMLRKLRQLDGVQSVRLNAKAASVTVYYEKSAVDAQQLVNFIHQECGSASDVQAGLTSPPATKPAQRKNWGAEIGRMALSVLVNKSVTHSLNSLLGARI